MIRCGSLFSGICDGFGLAAQWAGMEVVWQVEIEKKAHKYLTKNFPDSEKFYDIRDCGKHCLSAVDIIFGGDPCQPHSSSGKRRGTKDDRYLWPQMLRIIEELRPTFVLNENVVGSIHNLVLDEKMSGLEAAGYSTRAYVIPALAVGGAHRRDRVWLVAHSPGKRLQWNARQASAHEFNPLRFGSAERPNLHRTAHRYDGVFTSTPIDPELFGETDGVPDKLFKIKGLGNALVPQIPFVILSAIKQLYYD